MCAVASLVGTFVWFAVRLVLVDALLWLVSSGDRC